MSKNQIMAIYDTYNRNKETPYVPDYRLRRPEMDKSPESVRDEAEAEYLSYGLMTYDC